MSALAVAPPPLARLGGEPTLDDVLVGIWRGLSNGRAVGCPVCGADMKATHPSTAALARSTASEPLRGRCASCAATLE